VVVVADADVVAPKAVVLVAVKHAARDRRRGRPYEALWPRAHRSGPRLVDDVSVSVNDHDRDHD
jgi:hypothetical protein